MRRFGYYAKNKKVDGVYGPATTQAVMDFQRLFGEYDAEKNPDGLKRDGVVGPKTKAKILQGIINFYKYFVSLFTDFYYI